MCIYIYILGALDLACKTVKQVMLPMDKVFMLVKQDCFQTVFTFQMTQLCLYLNAFWRLEPIVYVLGCGNSFE